VQAITPPDHHAMIVFCKWILTKNIVKSQFVANFLFTDEMGFKSDGILNCHNILLREENSLTTTMASRHQHWFSTIVWVGTLGDQLLGPVVYLTD
jgi:hypothetical protein